MGTLYKCRKVNDVSAKRSNPCSGVHSTQYGMQYAVGTQYTVGTQYAVGVSAKRSTHIVDLAYMGGGDHYL